MRFDDSPELFGGGVGSSVDMEIVCEFCETVYNEGILEKTPLAGDSVPYTDFAGKRICFRCFEEIEAEIFRRMDDILKWYLGIMDDRLDKILVHKKHMSNIRKTRAKIEKTSEKMEEEDAD